MESKNSVEYQLKEPLKLGDKEVTKVCLSRPKMKHLKGLKLGELSFDQIGLIFGRISDQPTAIWDELSIDDGINISEIIGDFFPQSQKTGPQS